MIVFIDKPLSGLYSIACAAGSFFLVRGRQVIAHASSYSLLQAYAASRGGTVTP